MKKILSLLLVLIMTLSIFGCSKKGEDDKDKYANIKIAMVSDTIGTDQFILQAYNKIKDMSADLGFQFVSIECTDTAAWTEKTRNACVEGFNLIVGVGWSAGAPFSDLAEEFPDIKFAVIDTIAKSDKVKSIAYNTTDGAYVLGVMAATAFPDDDLFGYIGNFQQQSNFEYRYGFVEGVKSVNPDATFKINFADTYSDTSVVYNLAIQQAAAGCHFIMGSVANAANAGIYTAALELADKGTPIYTSGLSVDSTTPDNPYIVGGLTKDTGVPMQTIIEEYLAGNFTPGAQILGVKENAFCVVGVNFDAIYRNTDIITDEVLAAGKAAAKALSDGTIKLVVPMEADYKD